MEHTNELNIGKLNIYSQNNILKYEGKVFYTPWTAGEGHQNRTAGDLHQMVKVAGCDNRISQQSWRNADMIQLAAELQTCS